MQAARVCLEVGLRKSQQFSSTQSSQIEKPKSHAQNSSAYWRCLPRWQLGASLQETDALLFAEHTGYKLVPHNAERPAIRHSNTGIFQSQEAAHLSNER